MSLCRLYAHISSGGQLNGRDKTKGQKTVTIIKKTNPLNKRILLNVEDKREIRRGSDLHCITKRRETI